MGYLDRLKMLNSENCLPSPLSKPPKAPLGSFDSTHGARFQKITTLVRPADDAATASIWWLIHYPGRTEREACYPPATQAEMLAWHPDAVAAEPFAPTIRQPFAPMTAEEETAIRAWLARIKETDPATIAEVIEQCQRDADARDFFVGRT
jgi:hypothetical protein